MRGWLVAAKRGWVSQRVAGLAEQKALVLAALTPLGDGAVQGGSGALCHAARLPFHEPIRTSSA